jgi:hypothetical protein
MTSFSVCYIIAAATLVLQAVYRYCTPGYLIWYLKIRTRRKRLYPAPEPGSKGKKRLVVSLTTIPSRLSNICPCLNAILQQSCPPDLIRIHIPDFSTREKKPYCIPEYLIRHPAIRINRWPMDEGPILKLTGALKTESDPKTLIVTVDDDTIYPKNFLKTLLLGHSLYPDAAIGFRGWLLPRSGMFLDRHVLYANTIGPATRVDVLSGVNGVLYPRHVFGSDFYDRTKLPPQAFFVDDICISGYLHTYRTPRILLPFPMREPFASFLRTSRSNPLWKINRDGINDQTLLNWYFYPRQEHTL